MSLGMKKKAMYFHRYESGKSILKLFQIYTICLNLSIQNSSNKESILFGFNHIKKKTQNLFNTIKQPSKKHNRNMQKLRSLSRSIINDPVQKRVSQTRFKKHLQAIKKPYAYSSHASLKKEINLDSNDNLAMKISRFRKSYQAINDNIDPVIFENRSLVRKMQDIDKRKSQSLVSFKVPHTSQHKLFNDKIKQENKIIFDRIKQQRENIKTKKQLKKQSVQIDKMIMHSRRIKQAIKKVKKDKKSINFKFGKLQKEFDFKIENQRSTPVPLILR